MVFPRSLRTAAQSLFLLQRAGLCPRCVPAACLGTALFLLILGKGVFVSHFTNVETEIPRGECGWPRVTHWRTPFPG